MRPASIYPALVASLLVGVAIACTNALGNQSTANNPVTPAVQSIFTANCTASGCHNSVSQAGGLNLDPGFGHDMIGRPSNYTTNLVVNPGNPNQSELYLRLVTSDPTRLMPRGLSPLSPQDIQTINNWIATLTVSASPSPTPVPTPTPTLPPVSGPTVHFATDVMPIFTANCSTTACHDARTHQDFLDLSTPASAYLGLLGANGTGAVSFAYAPQLEVVPGNPNNSVLYAKISSNSPRIGNQPLGLRMPNTGVALSAAQIQTIQQWILQGAANN